MLKLTWVRILCNSCAEYASGPESKESQDMQELKSTVTTLAKSFAAQQAQLAKFLGPSESRPSRASGAGRDKAPPSFSALVTSAVSSAGEEEKRHRSIIADGVPVQPGVSDLERVNELIQYLDLGLTVRVQEVFRIGKGKDQLPPKLMIILFTKDMQRCLLSKEIRAKLREPACPPSFAEAYLNPSRNAEERRHLLLLRRRRDYLNEPIQDEDMEGWFIDYSRQTLVKRVGGTPDWKGAGDPGFAAWAEENSKTILSRTSPSTSPSSSSSPDPSSNSSSDPPATLPTSASTTRPSTRQSSVKTLVLPIPAKPTVNTKGKN